MYFLYIFNVIGIVNINVINCKLLDMVAGHLYRDHVERKKHKNSKMQYKYWK